MQHTTLRVRFRNVSSTFCKAVAVRKIDYKKSRLISFLELTSFQRSNLTAVLYAVPFSGSVQDDTRRGLLFAAFSG